MGEVGLLRMEVLQVEPILKVMVEMLLCLSGEWGPQTATLKVADVCTLTN